MQTDKWKNGKKVKGDKNAAIEMGLPGVEEDR